MDKIIIIYFSLTGNTKLLAHLIGDFLKEKGKTSDYFRLLPEHPGFFLKNCRDALTRRKAALKELPDISGYDTLFLGSPVWAFNVAPAIRGFLETVPLSGKNVFIFATHGGGPGKAMKEFADAVESRDGKVIGVCDLTGKSVLKDFPNLKPLLEKLL
ncbi:MAG: flavodoxin [Candidatus Omnitrophota bacterium]